MEQRLSVVTLGVSDLARARSFYEGLGRGGYSGAFIDPDGHSWALAHNPHWMLAGDGSIELAA